MSANNLDWFEGKRNFIAALRRNFQESHKLPTAHQGRMRVSREEIFMSIGTIILIILIIALLGGFSGVGGGPFYGTGYYGGGGLGLVIVILLILLLLGRI
jgi:hypothetical protein